VVVVGAVALGGCSASSPAPSLSSTPTSVPSTTASSSTPASTNAAFGPVIIEPDAGMAPIYDFMRQATSTLTMTMYELVDPTAERILASDAARGVHVRVLLDSALENTRNRPAQTFLASHAVTVALAPASRITHQKTICIDDDSCLVMSLNMVASDYSSTRDVAVPDSDAGDVAAIEATFAADFAGHSIDATAADHLLWSPGSETGLLRVIAGAHHTLQVENEEMASSAVTDALAAAARRGVSVNICMTADSSYTRALDQIAAAGGHVHLYPDRAGVLYIHEKLIIADPGTASATAAVGSINFSTSSMSYNRELDLILDNGDAPAQIAALSAAFQRDFGGAPEL
jgi:cardiolipin synthase